MDLVGCAPLSSWTCLVVRLYLGGLVLVFAFSYIDVFDCLRYLYGLFGCSPLPTLACLLTHLYL